MDQEIMMMGHEVLLHSNQRENQSEESLTPPGAALRQTRKKIPAALRRKNISIDTSREWYQRLLHRLQHDSQFLRSIVQFTFILLCLLIGIEFHLFMKWGASGGTALFISRPPGVEGFLPISALMSLKYWWQTGIINDVHPAGLYIFIAVLVTGIFLKKAFCSWLCPVGTLSESLWMLGQKLFRKNLTINRWLDYPLRSLKYLLLLFFAYSIWQMDIQRLTTFLYSPYNKMADVKMYLFFAEISTFALWTILILIGLSVIVKNFWCRYLCPYGALLGALSFLSPLKITRQKETCTDCQLCTQVCPANISVHAVNRVWSDECTACYSCIEACPVKNTLEFRMKREAKPVPSWIFGCLTVGVFLAVTGLAMLTGHWRNSISNEEYLRRFSNIDSPLYQHQRGEVQHYGPND